MISIFVLEHKDESDTLFSTADGPQGKGSGQWGHIRKGPYLKNKKFLCRPQYIAFQEINF
jgi:hypothetical protein